VVTFAEFTALCRALAATRSRLTKTALTAEFLRRLSANEIRPAVAFLTARPTPASDSRVVEVSWAAVSRAMRDAGAAAPEATLTLLDVSAAFDAIASATGAGSRRAKAAALRDLLARATDDEGRIIANILLGEMRIGLHDGLIQDAVARAAQVDAALVRRAALFLSDLAEVAAIALAEGAEGLGRAGIRLFIPLLPMLAEVSEDFDEVFEAHGGRSALEFKYDGARIQIHKDGDHVRVWSRRLTEVTSSLPEIVDLVRREVRAASAVLDGEVVAVGSGGRPLPFQDLMRRFGRVHDIEAASVQIPLELRLFDCLYLDGRSFIDEPYASRWEALEDLVPAARLARRIVTDDAAAARAFFKEALASGHEGVMAKDLQSAYTPGSRGKRWFKVKPAETVDCVVTAVDWGSGRRTGWLSNYHLAVQDDAGGFAPVGKTFKGLTDDEHRSMTARFQQLRISDDGYTVTVRPEVVVEVAYNEIQRSPIYSSGFALRFARVTRFRDDKSPAQATTLPELRALYERQFAAKSRLDL
jgi:DNA ligase-1